MRRYATLCRRVVERKNSVGRAARFERADLLKIFTLKKQRCAARLIQPGTLQHRRTLDVPANSFMRRANAIKIESHYSILSSTGHARLSGRQNHLPIRKTGNQEILFTIQSFFPHFLIHPSLGLFLISWFRDCVFPFRLNLR
jgi:hypothetical protein